MPTERWALIDSLTNWASRTPAEFDHYPARVSQTLGVIRQFKALLRAYNAITNSRARCRWRTLKRSFTESKSSAPRFRDYSFRFTWGKLYILQLASAKTSDYWQPFLNFHHMEQPITGSMLYKGQLVKSQMKIRTRDYRVSKSS